MKPFDEFSYRIRVRRGELWERKAYLDFFMKT